MEDEDMNPPPHLSDFANLDTATLMRHLPGVVFPAEKEQVASTAENNGAPQEVVQRIRNTSRQRFNGPEEVLQAVQGH
jgi:hypothetical protein